jgi:MFS family permease
VRFDAGQIGSELRKVNQLLRCGVTIVQQSGAATLPLEPLRGSGQRARVPRSATLQPLENPAFRLILTGALMANLGNAIQSVGAAWSLTASGQPADVVALVQTALNLPILLLALPAGAFADMFDRRRMILAAQGAMLALSLLLAALALGGSAPPAAIIVLTALLACGIACFSPAMAGSIGGVVPRAQLAAAVALNILAFNTARSFGPALGGAIVALGGAASAFVINALCYLVAIAVFWRWHGLPGTSAERRPLHQMIGEGLRFALHSSPIRTIMLRAFTFTATGAAAWALMPLVSADLLNQGSAVYGLLLGALGLGAVIGAATSTGFRARFSAEAIIRAAGVIYGAACILVALRPGLAAMLALLVVAGAGWVQALSGFSVSGQLWSPRELVGRITAMVSSLTFGGIALGSWLWGHFAEDHGVANALLASGAAMVALPLLGLILPMPAHEAPSAP